MDDVVFLPVIDPELPPELAALRDIPPGRPLIVDSVDCERGIVVFREPRWSAIREGLYAAAKRWIRG